MSMHRLFLSFKCVCVYGSWLKVSFDFNISDRNINCELTVLFIVYRHGLAVNGSRYGPLTDLPDWSFAGIFPPRHVRLKP